MFLAHHRTVVKRPQFHHESTTNSPQKTIQKAPDFPKPPSKTPVKAQKKLRPPPELFSCKIKKLNAETRSTTTGALHRGILKLEPCSFQRLHIVHRAVLQIHR